LNAILPALHFMPASFAPLPFAAVGLRFGRHALAWLDQRYRTKSVRLALVCDRDAALAKQIGAEFGVPWTTDMDSVLGSDIPAVALFTPPAGRAALISQCIRAGKDVMTTKPFTIQPTKPLSEAARIMHDRRVHRLFVLNENQELLGVITAGDIMRAMSHAQDGIGINDPSADAPGTQS
jgi:hypothetical protein